MPVMRLRRPLIVATLLALAAAACVDDESFATGGFGGSGGSGVVDGSVSDPLPYCDTIGPTERCENAPALEACETRTSANINCNASLRCDEASAAGTWYAVPPLHPTCATDCPPSYADTNPNGCAIPNPGTLICEYPEGTCGCAPVRGAPARDAGDAGTEDAGSGDAGPEDASIDADAGDAGSEDADAATQVYEWRCVQPDRDAGCPRERPREGEECVRPMQCDYGVCVFEDGVQMDCYSGYWVQSTSTRSAQCDQ